MLNKITSIVSKLKDQRNEYVKKDAELETRTDEKFGLLRKDMNFKFDVTTKEVEKMKSYVTQMCEMTKVTTSEMVENEIIRVGELYDKVKEELIDRTDGILKKNKKSISNIKNTCAIFFDKYDKALMYMQRRFDNINETFTNYEKNTFQPVQVREARLHYIETQLKEQNKQFEVEHDFFAGILKKLLMALEQSVFISGTECISLSKRSHKYAQYQSHRSPSDEKLGLHSKNKFSTGNIRLDGNKSVIEPTGESFLPSLTRNTKGPDPNVGTFYIIFLVSKKEKLLQR